LEHCFYVSLSGSFVRMIRVVRRYNSVDTLIKFGVNKLTER